MNDTFISINHRNLISPVFGYAKVDINERGIKGLSIFIPAEHGEKLLKLLKVNQS